MHTMFRCKIGNDFANPQWLFTAAVVVVVVVVAVALAVAAVFVVIKTQSHQTHVTCRL